MKKPKFTGAKFRRYTRKFVCHVLSNMTLRDRWKFVFTGNYIEALQRTYERLNRKGKMHE